MAYMPIEHLLPKADYSIYKLVRMASKRASELADNKPNLIGAPSTQKLTTVALQEIMEGKVTLKLENEKKSSKDK